MKKSLLTLGAVLAFGMASAQVQSPHNMNGNNNENNNSQSSGITPPQGRQMNRIQEASATSGNSSMDNAAPTQAPPANLGSSANAGRSSQSNNTATTTTSATTTTPAQQSTTTGASGNGTRRQ